MWITMSTTFFLKHYFSIIEILMSKVHFKDNYSVER